MREPHPLRLEHRRGLLGAEPQVTVADVVDPALETKPRKMDGGVGASAENDVHASRRPAQQQVQRLQDGGVAHEVYVVQQQPERIGNAAQDSGEPTDEAGLRARPGRRHRRELLACGLARGALRVGVTA